MIYKGLDTIKDIKRLETTLYSPILTDEEKLYLIELYKGFSKGNLFDRDSVRLDEINLDGSIKISIIPFYDFIITTLVRLKFKDFYLYIKEMKDRKGLLILKKLHEEFIKDGWRFKSFTDVINQNKLANLLAVSVMVKTIDNQYLIVERNNKNIVGSGLHSVSVTGALDIVDFDNDNPITSCAWRELYEELGIMVQEEDMEIKGLVMGRNKQQPTVMLEVSTYLTSNEVIGQSKYAKDFQKELVKIMPLDKEGLNILLNDDLIELTEVARYQINEIVRN